MIITVITTGGTIDKTYATGAGVRDYHIGPPVANRILPLMVGAESNTQFRFIELMRKDSLDMTDADRIAIVTECWNHRSDTAIMVVHGTDTMIDTARAIHNSEVGFDLPIVLTGASKPAGMLADTDALFNLGLALGACVSRQKGVWVAMHGIHQWDRCVKNPETGTFVPHN